MALEQPLLTDLFSSDKIHPPHPIEVVIKQKVKIHQDHPSSDSEDENFQDAQHDSMQMSLSTERPDFLGSNLSLDAADLSHPDDFSDQRSKVAFGREKNHVTGPFKGAERLLDRIVDDPVILNDEENEDDEEDYVFCFPVFDAAREQANTFARKVWMASWKVTHFYSLPEWLQDNDFLHTGHRPPLNSVGACFRSIFRVHTETGNIWTHMIGCVAFFGIAAYFLTRPNNEVQWEDKLAFLPFFIGAVACLGLSFAFHTMHCHSEKVGKIFSKLDYVGIALLIMGSFVPWLHYGFYCRMYTKISYITAMSLLGICCIVISLWDRFSEPRFRPLRAGLFMGLGLSALIPCGHYFIVEGFWASIYEASMGWLILMAILYISGALLYAFRVPERFFPGKCDLMFQSHQIFHLLVIAAAFVHYHGVTEMAVHRLSGGSCAEKTDKSFIDRLITGQQLPEWRQSGEL